MATEQGVIRKLSAILSADVKGYSRLMTEDEAYTIKTLKEYRNIMSEIINRHSGRVVDAPGDNLMAEFSSVVNAVQCSVEIQNTLKEKNTDFPDDKRLEFRIGVNIGDVVQDGDSLYGEGVNIAARIEGLADPGGVCISRGAYDHVKNKLKLGYEFIGEHAVKNIKDPVRVYKVLMAPADVGKLIGEEPKLFIKNWIWTTIVVTAIVFTLIGYQFFQKVTAPEFKPASVENMAFPLPDKPSIAVLPFDDMSEDKDQDYFCDGITEDIIAALSKTSKIFVIARNSTFTYKGKAIKVQQIAEELGVHYVLEGSVRKSGDRLRITAQLIDALTGHHLWAERYDRDLKEIFALQDEITIKIISALQVKLTDGEIARIEGRGTQNLEAYLKILKAGEEINKVTKEGFNQVRRLCEEAIVLDPDYAMAYRYLGTSHWMEITIGTSKSPKASFKLAFDSLKKSKALNNSLPLPVLGFLYIKMKEYDKGIAECEKAVDLMPNSGNANIWMSLALTVLGRHKEAVKYAEQALRLDPLAAPWYPRSLGYVYSWVGRYEEAITAYKKAIQGSPNDLLAHIHLTIAYTWADRLEEARAQSAEILKIRPNFTVGKHAKAFLLKEKADQDRYFGALLKAGLPENPPLQLPDKPSIAVLPFDNMSGDPEQEYFSDGITEDIITALSKTPQMFVIARNSTFTYKGKSVRAQEVGRDLGVQYVLEGSIRKVGDKVRITAQLIDAKTAHHLWAEKYDRDFENIFALQDEIIKKIITELHVELDEGEQARIGSKGTDNLDAYLKVKQARWYSLLGSRESNTKARQLVKEAIAIAPDYAYAYRILGVTHIMDAYLGMGESPKKSIQLAMESYKKAIVLNETLASAYSGLGYVHVMMREYEEAVRLGKKAFDIEPNSPDVIKAYASILTYDGRWEEAIPLFRLALRLNPKPPTSYYRSFGHALRLSGQHEEAIALQKKAIEHNPNDLLAHLILAVSASLGGFDEEAQAAAKEMLRIDPQFSEKRLTAPFKDKTHLKTACDALNKAGLNLDCDALK